MLIDRVASLVKEAILAAFGEEHAELDAQVRRSQHADLQADVALGLARRVKTAPRAVAEKLVRALPSNDVIERVDIAGPGFLNVTLKPSFLGGALDRALADDRLGIPRTTKPERIVVDYSAPNVAKEMHVGHLRSTVIGDALVRILGWQGHDIIRQNHIGDWGTPFGMLIEHLLDVGDERDLALGELSAFYKAARQKFDADPALAERSRLRVVALQGGDEATLSRWRVLVDLSIRYFETVYAKLGITLRRDDVRGESFYNDRLGPLAAELEQGGHAKISEGALCLYPPGFEIPLIVRKRDGGFNYAATDLAAIRYRVGELRVDRILYVVGAPQAQHFGMVFAAARELGWLPESVRAEHIAFGSVLGTDKKKFASRSGDAVRLIDLVDAAIDQAAKVLGEKAPDLAPDIRAEVARQVGAGAIKYADLSSDRMKDYAFDLDRMISFDGNTAGYAQYAHARIRSILRKAESPRGAVAIEDEAERTLALELLGFENAVRAAADTLEPHRLATYVYGLATAFTRFYDQCPILKATDATRASRLSLAELTARTIAQALDLLGIEAPDRM